MNLNTFKQAVATTPPSLCMILGGEIEEPISWVVKTWSDPVVYDASSFGSEGFLQEVETLPFLKSHVYVHVKQIDLIKERKALETYAMRPSAWVSLLVTGAALPANSRLVKTFSSQGIFLRVADAKPWEKQAQCADRLMHLAAEEGITLMPEAARALVSHLGVDRALLIQELEKLICYVGKKRQITAQDVAQLTATLPQETLWQLGDALMARNRAVALTIAHRLLYEGVAFFALVAGLRTQLRTALDVLAHYQHGGEAAVRAAFPYLRGGLAHKKVKAAEAMGARRLRAALIDLYDCELQAKSSSLPPAHLLDLFIATVK